MDYSEYHPDWKDVIRPAILKRDNYRCRICGIPNKALVYKLTSGAYKECDEFMAEWARNAGRKVFKVSLQIAHIDNNKLNNEPENLLTLCPRHHAKMDADHKRFLRISFREKVAESKHLPLPQELKENTELFRAISDRVKEFTHVRIETTQAEDLYFLILNSIQNVKN